MSSHPRLLLGIPARHSASSLSGVWQAAGVLVGSGNANILTRGLFAYPLEFLFQKSQPFGTVQPYFCPGKLSAANQGRNYSCVLRNFQDLSGKQAWWKEKSSQKQLKRPKCHFQWEFKEKPSILKSHGQETTQILFSSPPRIEEKTIFIGNINPFNSIGAWLFPIGA